jgi:hypothetical protein
MESNRKRLSGTISLINRINQLKTAFTFWMKIVVGTISVFYGAGLYYFIIFENGNQYGVLYIESKILEWLYSNRSIMDVVRNNPSCADIYSSLLHWLDTSALPTEIFGEFAKNKQGYSFIEYHRTDWTCPVNRNGWHNFLSGTEASDPNRFHSWCTTIFRQETFGNDTQGVWKGLDLHRQIVGAPQNGTSICRMCWKTSAGENGSDKRVSE